jgi:hypothetical protein
MQTGAIITGLVRSTLPVMPRNEVERIRKALRAMFYGDEAMMGVLAKIAIGTSLDVPELSSIEDSADHSKTIERHIETFKWYHRSGMGWVTQDFLAQLDLVRDGAYDLRGCIVAMIQQVGPNMAFSDDQRLHASNLLAERKELNRAIDGIDTLVRLGR